MNATRAIKTVLLFAFLANMPALAQEPATVIDRIVQQIRLFPQEKTYMHTDASDYGHTSQRRKATTCMWN